MSTRCWRWAVNLAHGRRGLENASSSSPATCNLGCLTVNIDIDAQIDAQTMQAAQGEGLQEIGVRKVNDRSWLRPQTEDQSQ